MNPNQQSQDFSSAGVRRQMQLPKGMESAYDKVIKAGLKLMFDPSMREETLQFMEDSNGEPAAMAEGVSSVVVMLFKESNETIPPVLLIPAGVELLVHAVEVARKGGADVSNEQVAEGMGQMVEQILTKFGTTPEQMQQLMSGSLGGSTNGAAAQGV